MNIKDEVQLSTFTQTLMFCDRMKLQKYIKNVNIKLHSIFLAYFKHVMPLINNHMQVYYKYAYFVEACHVACIFKKKKNKP